MTNTKFAYPVLLKLCAAVVAALPLAASAGLPDWHPSAKAAKSYQPDTDRLIVKYKDAVPSGKRAAFVPQVASSRMAIAARAGQSHGVTMRAMHATATGATSTSSTRRCRSQK